MEKIHLKNYWVCFLESPWGPGAVKTVLQAVDMDFFVESKASWISVDNFKEALPTYCLLFPFSKLGYSGCV